MADKLIDDVVWVLQLLADHSIVKVLWYLDSAILKDLKYIPSKVVVAQNIVEGYGYFKRVVYPFLKVTEWQTYLKANGLLML
jgi:hypothetical protein